MYLDTCTVLPHLGSLEGHALIGKAEQKLQPRYPATIGACPYNQSSHEHLDIGHHQAQPFVEWVSDSWKEVPGDPISHSLSVDFFLRDAMD